LLQFQEDNIATRDNGIPATMPVSTNVTSTFFALPACARRMLNEGVRDYQRVACFRLAIHLKRIGLPVDLALATLKSWADKNQPPSGKRIITESEIISQPRYAYQHNYRGYGCGDPAIIPYCDPQCPLVQKNHHHIAKDTHRGEKKQPQKKETATSNEKANQESTT